MEEVVLSRPLKIEFVVLKCLGLLSLQWQWPMLLNQFTCILMDGNRTTPSAIFQYSDQLSTLIYSKYINTDYDYIIMTMVCISSVCNLLECWSEYLKAIHTSNNSNTCSFALFALTTFIGQREKYVVRGCQQFKGLLWRPTSASL